MLGLSVTDTAQSSNEEMKDEVKENGAEQDAGSWSEEDVSKLLDGINQFKDDWDSIARNQFDNIKSPSDCVLKFLELPLTESMISKVRDTVNISVEATKSMAVNS